MSNELELDEFNILNKETTKDGDYIYTVEAINKPQVCPTCGARLHKHKKVQRKVRDLSHFGSRVGIIIEGHRYRCSNPECGALVGEEYESVVGSGQLTTRLRDTIKKEAFFKTFKEISEEYTISTATVAELFKEQADELNAKYRLIAPKILGIDEIHIKGNYYGVFVDIQEQRVIEIKDNRTKKTVVTFIESLPDNGNITCVTMDMWRPYRDAVYSCLPDVPVVVDKFHVIKELNVCMDEIRKKASKAIQERNERISLKNNRYLLLSASENLSEREHKNLQVMLDAYPEFSVPYLLKEAFRNIYLAKSRDEAEELYNEWLNSCLEEKIVGFNRLIETVANWHKEIFNYFDYPYTNAQTESLNNTIRDLDRDGRGYSFQVLRDKIVLKHMLTRKKSKFIF